MTYQEEIAKIKAETARIKRIHEAFKQTMAVLDTKDAVQEQLRKVKA